GRDQSPRRRDPRVDVPHLPSMWSSPGSLLKLSFRPLSSGGAVATPQVVIGKCLSEKDLFSIDSRR
ncbi:jg14986, partial [Pararge aegeria aegeria]